MSVIKCERCGFEALVVVRRSGEIDVRWPSELGFTACHFAHEHRVAGEAGGPSCPYLEQEIAAARAANLLTRDEP